MISFHKFYVLFTEHIYTIVADLKKSYYLPKQRQLTDFYIPEGECLLRGTNWM